MQSGFDYWPDIAPPVFLFPTDPAIVVGAIGVIVTLAPFISANTLQAATDYEIWTGARGTGSLIGSSYNDPNMLLKTVPGGALPNGTLYLRARMASTMKQSGWSADKVLTVV